MTLPAQVYKNLKGLGEQDRVNLIILSKKVPKEKKHDAVAT